MRAVSAGRMLFGSQLARLSQDGRGADNATQDTARELDMCEALSMVS